MKKRIFRVLFTICLFTSALFGINVYAYNSSLVSSKSKVNTDEEFTIKINATGLSNKLAAFTYNLSYDSDLFEYVSMTSQYAVNKSTTTGNLKIAYVDYSGGDNAFDNGTIATITFKAKSITSDDSGTFSLTSSGLKDIDGSTLSSTNTSTNVNVHVVSTINTLDDLKIDSVSVSNFDKNELTYNVTTTNASVTIDATKTDSNSSITGTGTKNLNYGNNEFEIKVTSESGSAKTYKLNITRTDTRSANNDLKSLIIENLNFSFSKTKLTYELSTNLDKAVISATADDNTATVTGTGTKELNYGKNIFEIKVKNERGETKTYTIILTRVDTRSENNYLKTLTLSTGTINFNKNTSTYNVTVDKNTTTMTIGATLEDSKSSFVSGYGPKTINLVNGNNTVTIKVKSEKETIRTYIIYINKDDGRDSNADLAYLKVNEGTIEFNKDTLEYKITVLYNVETITVDAKPFSVKSTMNIENPTSLVVGENTITIKVTAENGAVKEYKIIVTKKEKGTTLSDNCNLSSITILNYELNFDKEVTSYDLTIKDEKSLNIVVMGEDPYSTYEITGNENLKNGSIITITVYSESGLSKEYKINIVKESSIPTLYIVIGGLIVILIALIILIIIKKKKQKENLNISSSALNSQKKLNDEPKKIEKIDENNKINLTPKSEEKNTKEEISKENTLKDKTPDKTLDDVSKINETLKINITSPKKEEKQEEKKQEDNKIPVVEQPKPYINKTSSSGLTKVCSNCGRRVPYEAGTCPYCLNNF